MTDPVPWELQLLDRFLEMWRRDDAAFRRLLKGEEMSATEPSPLPFNDNEAMAGHILAAFEAHVLQRFGPFQGTGCTMKLLLDLLALGKDPATILAWGFEFYDRLGTEGWTPDDLFIQLHDGTQTFERFMRGKARGVTLGDTLVETPDDRAFHIRVLTEEQAAAYGYIAELMKSDPKLTLPEARRLTNIETIEKMLVVKRTQPLFVQGR